MGRRNGTRVDTLLYVYRVRRSGKAGSLRNRLVGLRYLLFLLVLAGAARTRAQETVFDIPSADVLDRGKVYGELDGTIHPTDGFSTFTPRVVVGLGHNLEAGVNYNGLSAPTLNEMVISPTIKWRPWKKESAGWVFYVCDDLFFPVSQRSYDAGNYVYAMFTKTWANGTRLGFGGYDFTKQVVATGNRAGGQFTFERPLNKRLTLAAEWYTGNTTVGYVNTGVIVKATSKLTLYGAYQIGNSGVTEGNHQFLWEIGYNFN